MGDFFNNILSYLNAIHHLQQQVSLYILNLTMYQAPQECDDKFCQQKCCNYFGSCPDTFFSSTYFRDCYYYYTYRQRTAGEVAGIAIGAVIGVVVLVLIIVCCVRKCNQRNRKMQQTINSQNNAVNAHFNNNSNQQIIYTQQPPPVYFNQPVQQFSPIYPPMNQNMMGPVQLYPNSNPPYLYGQGPIMPQY